MTNDDFLYTRRETPRPEFAEALHQQLQQVKPVRSSLRRRMRPVMKAAAVFVLMSAAILAISPEARAYVSKAVEKAVEKAMEYLHFGDVQLNVVPGKIHSSASVSAGYSSETVSVADAQKILLFKVPAWLPNDWSAVDEASISRYDGEDEIIITLYYPERPPDNVRVPLMMGILNQQQPTIVVGQGHQAQLVDINGHEGTLYTGSWSDGEYGGPEKHVIWTMDNLTYYVSSTELSEDDLLKIARSVP